MATPVRPPCPSAGAAFTRFLLFEIKMTGGNHRSFSGRSRRSDSARRVRVEPGRSRYRPATLGNLAGNLLAPERGGGIWFGGESNASRAIDFVFVFESCRSCAVVSTRSRRKHIQFRTGLRQRYRRRVRRPPMADRSGVCDGQAGDLRSRFWLGRYYGLACWIHVDVSDLAIWGGVSLIFVALSWFGRREIHGHALSTCETVHGEPAALAERRANWATRFAVSALRAGRQGDGVASCVRQNSDFVQFYCPIADAHLLWAHRA